MTRITEIRVHGVSGTSPASMLKSRPVLGEVRPGGPSFREERRPGSPEKREKGRAPIEVWDPAPPPSDIDRLDVMAYNWSRLTSGRRRHAFWVLLMPYTFINVGGWMLPKRTAHGSDDASISRRTGAGLDVLMRVAGAAVTSIFAMFTAAIVLDLVLAKCRPGSSRCSLVDRWWEGSTRAWVVAGAIVCVAVVVFVLVLLRRDAGKERFEIAARENLRAGWGHQRPDDRSDPVLLSIADRAIWAPRRLTSHLGLLHVSVVTLVVTWVLVAILVSSGEPPRTLSLHVASTGFVLGAFVLASTWAPSDRLRNWAYAAGALTAVGLAVALVDTSGLSDKPWDEIEVAKGLATVTVVLSLVLAVIGLIVWLVGLSGDITTSGAASMIVLAALVANSFGAGVYMLVREFLIGGRSDRLVDGDRVSDLVAPIGGIDWAALGFLTFMMVQIGAILGTMAFAGLDRDTDALASTGLRNVTDKLDGHLFYPAAVAFVGYGLFLSKELTRFGSEIDSPFDSGGLRIGGLLWPDLLVLVLLCAVTWLGLALVLLYVRPRWVFAIAAFVVVCAVVLFVLLSPEQLAVAGFSIEVDSFQNLAVSLALLVPAGFILNRTWTMFTDRDQRRGMGILWDIGSFWPRWYHPFAAPLYAPVAVPDLAGFIEDRTSGDGEVIVAAHSQGSVIAMAALLTLDRDETDWPKIALLTYGSPICQLYAKLFPAHFDDATIDEVADRLTDSERDTDTAEPRWRNLWRKSDPIGGPIPQLGTRSQQIDACLRDGHSDYELTDEFRDARAALVAELPSRLV